MLQAPPIPKNEKPAVTISNQAVQIDNLLQRVEDNAQELARLRTERNEWRDQVKKLEFDLATERQFRRGDVERLNEEQALVAKLESQLEGYRMAIKDICS